MSLGKRDSTCHGVSIHVRCVMNVNGSAKAAKVGITPKSRRTVAPRYLRSRIDQVPQRMSTGRQMPSEGRGCNTDWANKVTVNKSPGSSRSGGTFGAAGLAANCRADGRATRARMVRRHLHTLNLGRGRFQQWASPPKPAEYAGCRLQLTGGSFGGSWPAQSVSRSVHEI